jgi:hypothetical protein
MAMGGAGAATTFTVEKPILFRVQISLTIHLTTQVPEVDGVKLVVADVGSENTPPQLDIHW